MTAAVDAQDDPAAQALTKALSLALICENAAQAVASAARDPVRAIGVELLRGGFLDDAAIGLMGAALMGPLGQALRCAPGEAFERLRALPSRAAADALRAVARAVLPSDFSVAPAAGLPASVASPTPSGSVPLGPPPSPERRFSSSEAATCPNCRFVDGHGAACAAGGTS